MLVYGENCTSELVCWETKSHRGRIPIHGIRRAVVGRRYPGLYDVLIVRGIAGNPPIAESTAVVAALLPKKDADDIAETLNDASDNYGRPR